MVRMPVVRKSLALVILARPYVSQLGVKISSADVESRIAAFFTQRHEIWRSVGSHWLSLVEGVDFHLVDSVLTLEQSLQVQGLTCFILDCKIDRLHSWIVWVGCHGSSVRSAHPCLRLTQ